MSNFLGDVYAPRRASSIVSTNELMTRENGELRKSMNYRDAGDLLSVFLVLPAHDGQYGDSWEEDTQTYYFDGHESNAREQDGESQMLMYVSGKLSDNGRFYTAAKAIEAGEREALQIQVYEKLDSGAWFDKGIFELVGAEERLDGGRKAYCFRLRPSDMLRTDRDDRHRKERFISARDKAAVWLRDRGRCTMCRTEMGLRFSDVEGRVELRCTQHRGETIGLLD